MELQAERHVMFNDNTSNDDRLERLAFKSGIAFCLIGPLRIAQTSQTHCPLTSVLCLLISKALPAQRQL
eukprot:26014-Eustigmatos_ZCMA.PRE.1